MKKMFSLSPVEYRTSAIEGRGVFAKRPFTPGEMIVPYAPKRRRLDLADPLAVAAAATKLTLLSEGKFVIVPDTTVPGGWLCNHSCQPNAAVFSDRDGRIQCTRPIAKGEEVSIFYGWVTENEPGRDPCRCGKPECLGYINFDVTDADAANVRIEGGRIVTTNRALEQRLVEYAEFLRSIGQEHVPATIATTLARMKTRLEPAVA